MSTTRGNANCHDVKVPEHTVGYFHSADLSGVELSSDLGRGTYDSQNPESVELQEGQSDAIIGLQVTGNVPQYNVTCKR